MTKAVSHLQLVENVIELSPGFQAAVEGLSRQIRKLEPSALVTATPKHQHVIINITNVQMQPNTHVLFDALSAPMSLASVYIDKDKNMEVRVPAEEFVKAYMPAALRVS